MDTFTLNPFGPYKPVKDATEKATFDYVGRYRVIDNIINSYFNGELPKEVLDVGGLGSLLPEITATKITILDEDTHAKAEDYDVGDGAKMPFGDGEFKVVVTSDTLEHIIVKDRKNFIKELLRVSDDLVILCAPFDKPGVANAEVSLNTFFTNLTGKGHRWLDEHIEYKLPKEEMMDRILSESGHSFIKFGQSNLSVWRLLTSLNFMAQELKTPEVLDSVSNLNQEYSRNIFSGDFGDNTYRTVYVVSKRRKLKLVDLKRQYSNELSTSNISHFIEELIAHQENLPVMIKRAELLNRITADKNNLEKELDHVYKSKSWAITKPLRYLMSLFS